MWSVELDLGLDLDTLIKETATDPDLKEEQSCLEDNKILQIPEDYKQVPKHRPQRWGITIVHDRIIIPKHQGYEALTALHFGINKMCSDATIFWWPKMQADIEKKSKTCSSCQNASKNLKSEILNSEKSNNELSKNPEEEIQIDFTGT